MACEQASSLAQKILASEEAASEKEQQEAIGAIATASLEGKMHFRKKKWLCAVCLPIGNSHIARLKLMRKTMQWKKLRQVFLKPLLPS